MQITQLSVENVKRIQAVQITPDGNLVVIGGKNGAGKSSLLDAIMYALAGGRSIPSQPLRKGESRGKVEITLDDAEGMPLTVVRTFTAKGATQLTIKTGGGYAAPTPQAILDELCGRLAFDPLAFTRQQPKQQADTLRRAVGLDFTEQDKKRKQLYDERTTVNRETRNLSGQLDGMSLYGDVPAAEISITDLTAQLTERTDAARRNRAKQTALEAAELAADGQSKRVEDLATELAEAEAHLKELAVIVDRERKAAEDLEDEDTDDLREQIAGAEVVNAKVRSNRTRAEICDALDAKEADSKKLTAAIDQIDSAKQVALSEAAWPVEGLGFDADGVTLDGLPFEQASQAERLRVSVAMGVAMNPKLRIQLIRDASLLDEQSLAQLAELAEMHNTQLWLERVGDGEECAVIIEDGTVRKEAADG
jgi:DNA repair exonuclease SbcCD ATPase subunit